ncbi:hypothetical protein WJX72_012193 [[Myrmecia] bisecta]|uniref:Protein DETOXIFICATION n=1 Tax=[Myrmecia] bisecta TaxID=41462 RepID=A0AAW1QBB2_9CHLO
MTCSTLGDSSPLLQRLTEWQGLREAGTVVQLSLPVSTAFLLNKSLSVVSVVFVGHLGAAELAAASLASSLANVTGYAVLAGLSSALQTLCGQAYGAKNYAAVGQSWQRALLILGIACVPISVLWLCIEPLLLLAGQEAQVASMAASYMRLLIPGVWSYGGFVATQYYLQAQGIVRPSAYVSAVAAAVHPLVNLLLIHWLGLGFLGAAVATAFSNAMQFLLLLFVICYFQLHAKTWQSWSQACLQGWPAFLKLAIPGLLLISEWWASEVTLMLGGWLPDAQRQLSAMAIYQTTNALCFMVPLGLAVAMATRVANELGAGNPGAAKLAAETGGCLALMVTLVMALGLIILRKLWGSIFTNDAALVSLVGTALVVLAPYVVFDGLQTVLSGVIRGAGRQAAAVPVVLFSYYVVGLPTAGLLGFKTNMGVQGLCTGMLLGTAVHAGAFLTMVLRMEWDREAETAQQRVAGVLPTLSLAGADRGARSEPMNGEDSRPTDADAASDERQALLELLHHM